MGKFRAAVAAVALAPLALGLTVVTWPAAIAGATPPPCFTAGTTGLSAAFVASSGQRIDGGTVPAGGCDVGIYVGPGVQNVVIDGVTVTGANDHGVFVQDTSHVTIENSTIVGSGVSPTPGIAENKAVELVGTTNSVVRDNTVTGNLADGGIGIADDGPIDPGAPYPEYPGTLLASTNNVVSGNSVSGNYGGCGIVLAAYNAGAGIFNNVVVGNTVTGTVGFTPYGPVIGGIVVAADSPGTMVFNNSVVHNTVTDSFIPGIIVHSNAPGDVVSNNSVVANTLNGDGWGGVYLYPAFPSASIGIYVATEAPTASLMNTTVAANRITNEDDGIYVKGASGTNVGGLPLDQATTPVVELP